LTILRIRIKPNAKQSRIEQTDTGEWVVSLQAPPVDGQANQALIKLLTKEWGIAQSRIQIKSGQTSRHKLIEITGDGP
jgi:hypothetical protein